MCSFAIGRRSQNSPDVHHAEKIDARKIRERSESFKDFFSQATLFWNSMSPAEKQHIISAGQFELAKVQSMEIRNNVVYEIFNNVDHEFAVEVARGIGLTPPEKAVRPNHGKRSPAVSMENTVKDNIKSRKVAALLADGFDYDDFMTVKKALVKNGAMVTAVSKFGVPVKGSNGESVDVDKIYVTTDSIEYDAVYVPGGTASAETLVKQGSAIHFVNEAFKHCKPIAAFGDGVRLLEASSITGVTYAGEGGGATSHFGVVTSRANGDEADFVGQFAESIAQHRHWDRETLDMVPA